MFFDSVLSQRIPGTREHAVGISMPRVAAGCGLTRACSRQAGPAWGTARAAPSDEAIREAYVVRAGAMACS
jgi:hypothetical protein